MTGNKTRRIYFASKVHHAKQWRRYRSDGYNVICTWIDEAEKGQTIDRVELAERCLAEVAACDRFIIYAEMGDELGGALIEMGAALAFGKPVFTVAPLHRFSVFDSHPLVTRARMMIEALV